jgi:hypothetical protein
MEGCWLWLALGHGHDLAVVSEQILDFKEKPSALTFNVGIGKR